MIPKTVLLAVALALVTGFGLVRAEDEDPKAAILESVDEVAKEVEEIRGLKFKEPFLRKVITPDDIEKIVREKLAEELPPEKLKAMNRALARMGFMSPEVSLDDCFAELLKAGAAGLYDPAVKTLYIVEGFSPKGAKPVIFHELVHALEDQHYDLDACLRKFLNDSDRAAGVQGLVEGSASFVTGQYLRRHRDILQAFMADQQAQAGKQAQMLMRVPVWLIAGMAMYPYFNAPSFVYYKTGGEPTKIADLYANIPESSEQILHPEKYGENADYPYRIRVAGLDKALPEGFKKIYEDSVGELSVGFLLNELQGGLQQAKLLRVMSRSQKVTFRGVTKTASEGWDGDWVAAYGRRGKECAFVWASRWDTEADAIEFATAYKAGLDYKWNSLKITPKTAQVEVRGDRVMVVEGFPAADMYKVVAAAWKGTTFVPDERDAVDTQ